MKARAKKAVAERPVGRGAMRHPCSLEPCTHTKVEVAMIRALLREIEQLDAMHAALKKGGLRERG